MKNNKNVCEDSVCAPFNNRSVFVSLLIYLALSVIVRWPSFLPSVIDHDESTYLLVARELLNGARLYETIWDNKPPGIFLLFAGTQYLFGQIIWAVRLLGAVAVAVTAFFVHRAVRANGGSSLDALCGGIVTIVLCSMHRSGLAANTELFFISLTAAAGWAFLRFPRRGLLLAALLCGIGATIKPVTFFDFAAFWFTTLLLTRGEKQRRSLPVLFAAPFLFVLPLVLLFVLFPLFGDRDELWRILFILPGRYRQEHAAISWFLGGTVFLFVLRLAWIVLPFARRVRKLWNDDRNLAFLPIFWFGATLLAVIAPGKFFDHYLLHLVPPLAIFASPELVSLGQKGLRVAPRLVSRGALLLVVLFFFQISAFIIAPDVPRIFSEHLSRAMNPNDRIFTDERLQVISYLLNAPLVSRYAHPTLLTKPEHNRALGIDGDREMAAILAQRPRYLIVGDRFRFRHLLDHENSGYHIVARHHGLHDKETLLYRRKGP